MFNNHPLQIVENYDKINTRTIFQRNNILTFIITPIISFVNLIFVIFRQNLVFSGKIVNLEIIICNRQTRYFRPSHGAA